MSDMVAGRFQATRSRVESDATRLDLIDRIFILSTFLAPLNLRIVRAFTAYDLVTGLLAFLIIMGPRRMRWSPKSLQLAALVVIGAGLASAFRATNPLGAVSQVVQLGFVFFVQLPVILTLARTRKLIHIAMVMFVSGYVLVILVAIFHQTSVASRVLPFYNQENPNALGLPVVFLLPFVAYFTFLLWRSNHRLLAVVAGAGTLYAMVWALTASASRGSTAATIISVVVFFVLRGGISSASKILLRVTVVLLALAAVVLVVYQTNLFPTTLKDRVLSTLNPQEQPHTVADARVALNRAGMRAFFSSPLVGTGFDNFRYVSQTFDDSATFHDPHNLWVQLLAQTGILGAGAFLFIIVRWYVLLIRTQAGTIEVHSRELLWAFVAAMTGLMAHSLLAPLVLQRHYWLLYGLGICAAACIAADR